MSVNSVDDTVTDAKGEWGRANYIRDGLNAPARARSISSRLSTPVRLRRENILFHPYGVDKP